MDGSEPLLTVAGVSFTQREWDIMPLLVRGFTDREIAAKLTVSVRTIDGHVGRILQKLDCKNRIEVVRWYDTVIRGQDLWKAVYALRMEGDPRSTIKTANVLLNRLTEEIKQGYSFPTILRLTGGLILCEKSAAYREFLSPDAISFPISKIFSSLKRLAKRCHSDALLGLAAYTVGDAYYIQREFGEAALWLKKAANLVPIGDERLRVLRVQAIALANIGEYRQFACVSKEAEHSIMNGETTNAERISETWEGLAHGLGVLWPFLPSASKQNDPFDVLDRGWAIYDSILAQNRSIPPYVRGLQLYRTEGILTATLSPENKANFLARGSEMMAIANKLPYRIKQELSLLLEF